MNSLSDRNLGLAGRVEVEERHRNQQLVALVMLDGTEIKGALHRHPGTRTLDYLNCQTESFVAMTDARVTRGDRAEHVAFVAINKAHIVRVIEAVEPD